jgi:hypothetical protein
MATAPLTHTSLIGRRRHSLPSPQTVPVCGQSAIRLGDDAFEHRDVDLVQVIDVYAVKTVDRCTAALPE